MLKGVKKIYFIGIGGIAMSAIAIALKGKGYEVTGSDEIIYSPSLNNLNKNEIKYNIGYDTKNITNDIDLFVVKKSSAPNEEYIFAKNKGLHIVSFPELLSYILKNHEPIVVAGTHGKTTITALMSWILETAGKNPSFLIGGMCKNFKENMRLTDSRYFVIEGDEYPAAEFDNRPKFLFYRPKNVILSAVELDHVNIFKDKDDYMNVFGELIEMIPKDGRLIAYADNPNNAKLISHANCNVATYGLNSEYQAKNINFKDKATFDLYSKGKYICTLKTSLFGHHNILNILGAVSMSLELGIDKETIKKAVETFKGVSRRLDMVLNNDVTIIDDYAHHPTHVKESIHAIRLKFPKREIFAVFEPKTFTTRYKSFLPNYRNVFKEADHVIISKVYKPGQIPKEQRITAEDFVRVLKKDNIDAISIENVNDIVEFLKKKIKPKSVVVFMSPGNFEDIVNKMITALDS